jgi:hypothetical protein
VISEKDAEITALKAELEVLRKRSHPSPSPSPSEEQALKRALEDALKVGGYG